MCYITGKIRPTPWRCWLETGISVTDLFFNLSINVFLKWDSVGKMKCWQQWVVCSVWGVSQIWEDWFYSLIGFFASQTVYFLTEYTITMYDTKKKELRWNATYFDYAATLPDEDIKYSKNLIAVSLLQWGFVYRQKYSDFSLCSACTSAHFYPSHTAISKAC